MDSIRHKIILVDDNMANLTLGRHMLKMLYEVYPAPSAAKLFEILEQILPDLVLLDIEMPEMNGYEAIKKMKADARFADIPVIFLTAKSDVDSELEGFNLGAADYMSKPFFAPLLLKRIANQLLIVRQKKALLDSQAALKEYANTLEIMVNDKTKEVFALQNAVLATVANLAEFRDELAGNHITRVLRYLEALIAELIQAGTYADELIAWDLELFLHSAQLHDVGKLGISDLIVNKPAKLSPEEFELMKTHVTVGVDAIERIIRHIGKHVFLHHALLVVGTHHEKWDGSGYPTGLTGTNIPLEGRLMAIADVYDALVNVRPYKGALSHEEACKIIEAGAGTHFDPVLVDAFRNVEGEFARIVRELAA